MSNLPDYTIVNQTQQEYQVNFPAARCICNIYAKANECLNLEFVWKDGNGIAKNLSDYTGKMSIKERKDGHIVVATCGDSPEDDGTLETFSNGHIKIYMDADKFKQLYKSGTWVYDILLKSPDGLITRLIEGNVYIDRGVTEMNNS